MNYPPVHKQTISCHLTEDGSAIAVKIGGRTLMLPFERVGVTYRISDPPQLLWQCWRMQKEWMKIIGWTAMRHRGKWVLKWKPQRGLHEPLGD